MIGKFKGIGGEVSDILFDNKIKKLDLELGTDRIGTPLIQFRDCTNKSRDKTLFTLHIKEAIKLKAVIDKLVFDYLAEKGEEK